MEWTIRTLMLEKAKQDTIDEAAKRSKKKMAKFVEGFFVRQHGATKDAERKQLAFTEGIKKALEPSDEAKISGSRSFTGEFKVQMFAAMAGIGPVAGDTDRDLEESRAFAFYQELEKKVGERMQGAGEKEASEMSNYMLLERAVDLLRTLYPQIKVITAPSASPSHRATLSLSRAVPSYVRHVACDRATLAAAGVARRAHWRPTGGPPEEQIASGLLH